MRSRYFSGVIREGRTTVMRYKADPTVREIDAVQDTFAWGMEASPEQRLALAQHLLRSHGAPEHLVREFADEVIQKMASYAMWMIAEDDILNWVESHQVAA